MALAKKYISEHYLGKIISGDLVLRNLNVQLGGIGGPGNEKDPIRPFKRRAHHQLPMVLYISLKARHQSSASEDSNWSPFPKDLWLLLPNTLNQLGDEAAMVQKPMLLNARDRNWILLELAIKAWSNHATLASCRCKEK